MFRNSYALFLLKIFLTNFAATHFLLEKSVDYDSHKPYENPIFSTTSVTVMILLSYSLISFTFSLVKEVLGYSDLASSLMSFRQHLYIHKDNCSEKTTLTKLNSYLIFRYRKNCSFARVLQNRPESRLFIYTLATGRGIKTHKAWTP